MYNICVFGGTTEGRELVEFLSAQPCNVTACVVTDYAQSLLPASGHVTVSAKKLPAGEIAAMLLSQRFDLVVDATHPYAPSRGKTVMRPIASTFMPFSGRKRSLAALERNMTHRSAPPASLRVK